MLSDLLPKDLPSPPTYSKINPADAPIAVLALTSEALPLYKVHDFASTVLVPKLSQLDGVGLASIEGGQKRAVRIASASVQSVAAHEARAHDGELGAGRLGGHRRGFTTRERGS